MLMQLSPTVAWRLTPDVWIGLAPTVNLASLELSVFPGTAPQMFDSPIGALSLYPDAPASWAVGFGFQAGVHARSRTGLSGGLSFKSCQRFQDFEFSPTTEGAADYTFRLDYPMVLSGGIAYEGFPGLLLAADVRYIDFENATGFDDAGFGPNGEVLGFGWSSITVVAIGAQYEVAPGIPVRIGYSFNDNPVKSDGAFFNTPAPAIITQHISGGASYRVSERINVSLAAQLGLSNDVTGTWMTINSTDGSTVGVPGTSVTSELSTFTIIGGVSIAL
jgi:long-chain fatty acid transport protein